MQAAAQYLRVGRSSARRIEKQKAALDELANELHVDVIETYIDNGFSGRRWRPALHRLVDELARFDVVLVYDVARLSRDADQLGRFVVLCNMHNVAVEFAQ
jgi:site-specific DNA recombinase